MPCIVNNGNWCQVSLPSGEPCIRVITSILRRFGYAVRTSSIGMQVTRVGSIRLTLVDIRPGSNPDTYGAGDCVVNDCIRSHSVNVGDF